MDSSLRIEALTINNFATIKNQEVEFSEGFNVIVGETGSGKSLILDALQLALGARADKKLVRKGSNFATVEVSFKINPENSEKVQSYCNEIGFPFEDNIHIKRVIYKEGNSKAFLNHQSCPIGMLSSFTRKFVDLVGQFENQKLLSPEYQLKLLDSYSSLGEKFNEYTTLYSLLKNLKTDLERLEDKVSNREREIDYLQFQLDEFSLLNPTVEGENDLVKEKNLILNSEKILKLNKEFKYFLFEQNDGGIISSLRSFANQFNISNLEGDNELIEKFNLIESTLYEIEEATKGESLLAEDSEQRLEEILDVLDRYQKLKRKFSLPTEALQEKQESLSSELRKLLDIETEIDTLKEKLNNTKSLCLSLATDLHKKRTKSAKKLSTELTNTIQKLNMEGAKIKFLLSEKAELSSTGISDLELTAETNPGEGFFKLGKIASGGELSRILLSLRHLMTTQDSISVFLFDEIDTGIGGKTAIKIGNMLREISSNSQVIAITHLPQIASFSNNLVVVEKSTIDSRTESKVFNYSNEERSNYINEMAQLTH
ncbi:MAG: DNA repair protein RecN (Recombination protein N) [Bacteriovoracaceae bacterium]|jgi:DNA repair protein RecN (Recombination protein N)